MTLFDAEAIEAAAKAIWQSEQPEWAWDNCGTYHWLFKKRAADALSAAEASMRERGLVNEETWNEPSYPTGTIKKSVVTIIRKDTP